MKAVHARRRRDAAVVLVPATRAAAPRDTVAGGGEAPGNRGVKVDEIGHFEFTRVTAGHYRLVASPGSAGATYLPARFPDPLSDGPPLLTISGDHVLDGVEIRLPRAAVITGRIVDEHGSPLAMAAVTVEDALPGNRRARPAGPAAATASRTDDTGSFRIFGLRPGEYLLKAEFLSMPGHMTMVLPGGQTATYFNRGYASAYYPGVSAASSAARLRVGPGEVFGPIEFALAAARFVTVRGVVLDPSGQPVPSTNVYLRPAGAMPPTAGQISGPTRADGTFEITSVPPGEYSVSVYRFAGHVREFAWMPLSVVDDIEGLVVRLEPGITVSGRVLFEAEPPASVASLQIRSIAGGARAANAVGVQPNADRTFTLEHQYGPTLIRASGLEGWHLKSVLYGGQDVTDRPTEFVHGDQQLDVILTPRGATLTGVVTTSRGAAIDAAVLLLSDDPALWHERFTTTTLVLAGGDGRFRAEGLRAGRYLAVAIDREHASLSNTTPEYFELLARHAMPVMLHEEQPAVVNLTIVNLE